MPWWKMDDQFLFHEKARLAGKEGRNLYLSAICYCANQVNDGLIREGVMPTVLALAECEDGPATIAKLVEVGLFEAVEGGWQIHDYLDYNPSREQVMAERAAARERMQGRRSPDVRPNIPRTKPEQSENLINPVPGPVPPLSSLPPSTEDDPLVERLMQHGVTYTVGITLASGRDALAEAWLDYVDGHPNIPNVAAYLTKNIRAGRKPPTTGPPGKPPPARRTGMSEADREVQRELERARKAEKHGRDGPAAPT